MGGIMGVKPTRRKEQSQKPEARRKGEARSQKPEARRKGEARSRKPEARRKIRGGGKVPTGGVRILAVSGFLCVSLFPLRTLFRL
jgi:hypothetical protein